MVKISLIHALNPPKNVDRMGNNLHHPNRVGPLRPCGRLVEEQATASEVTLNNNILASCSTSTSGMIAEARAVAFAVLAGDERGDRVVEAVVTKAFAATYRNAAARRRAILSSVVKSCWDMKPRASGPLSVLSVLPMEDRCATVLVGLAGLTVDEAADVLEASAPSVAQAARRGNEALNRLKLEQA